MKKLILFLTLSIGVSSYGGDKIIDPKNNTVFQKAVESAMPFSELLKMMHSYEESGYRKTAHKKQLALDKVYLESIFPNGFHFSVSSLSVSRAITFTNLESLYEGRTAEFWDNLYSEYINERFLLANGQVVYTKDEWEALTSEEKYNLFFGVYYVTTSGSGTNNGLSETNAWSWAHAWDTAVAGDKINVMSGNYENLVESTVNAGTSGNPIVFEGYQTTADDITATDGPTFNYADWEANGDALNTALMPYFTTNDDTPVNDRTWLDVMAGDEYITIRNFMLAKYRIGVNVGADNFEMDNIIGDQFGWFDPNMACANATDDSCDDSANDNPHRQGWAVNTTNGAGDMVIKNCFFNDAGMVSIFLINGSNYLVEYTEATAKNPLNGPDYLFDLFGARYATLRNCMAIRAYGNSAGHQSRSYILQAQSDFSRIENCTARNGRLQFENTDDSFVVDMDMQAYAGASGENSVSIQFSTGTERCYLIGGILQGGGGIQVLGYDTISPTENPEPFSVSVTDTWVIDYLLKDLTNATGNAAFSAHRLFVTSTAGVPIGTMNILNITVDNAEYLFNSNNTGTWNIINSSINNVNVYETYVPPGTIDWQDERGNVTFTWTNSHFNGNGFSTPSGTSIITGAPLFTDPSNNDYSLQTGSPLIGAGLNRADYEGSLSGNNIGTYGFGTQSSGGVAVSTGLLNARRRN